MQAHFPCKIGEHELPFPSFLLGRKSDTKK